MSGLGGLNKSPEGIVLGMVQLQLPAVTTPSTTQAPKVFRRNDDGRGRTTTASSTPAHASRSHAAPSGPTRSNRPTDTARPSWTHSMAATARVAPERGEGGTAFRKYPGHRSRPLADGGHVVQES